MRRAKDLRTRALRLMQIALVGVFLLLSACSNPDSQRVIVVPAPTATAAPTSDPVPTVVPIPQPVDLTPAPTVQTPEPTIQSEQTPSPAPTATAAPTSDPIPTVVPTPQPVDLTPEPTIQSEQTPSPAPTATAAPTSDPIPTVVPGLGVGTSGEASDSAEGLEAQQPSTAPGAGVSEEGAGAGAASEDGEDSAVVEGSGIVDSDEVPTSAAGSLEGTNEDDSTIGQAQALPSLDVNIVDCTEFDVKSAEVEVGSHWGVKFIGCESAILRIVNTFGGASYLVFPDECTLAGGTIQVSQQGGTGQPTQLTQADGEADFCKLPESMGVFRSLNGEAIELLLEFVESPDDLDAVEIWFEGHTASTSESSLIDLDAHLAPDQTDQVLIASEEAAVIVQAFHSCVLRGPVVSRVINAQDSAVLWEGRVTAVGSKQCVVSTTTGDAVISASEDDSSLEVRVPLPEAGSYLVENSTEHGSTNFNVTTRLETPG